MAIITTHYVKRHRATVPPRTVITDMSAEEENYLIRLQAAEHIDAPPATKAKKAAPPPVEDPDDPKA